MLTPEAVPGIVGKQRTIFAQMLTLKLTMNERREGRERTIFEQTVNWGTPKVHPI